MNDTSKHPTPLLIIFTVAGFVSGYGCGIIIGDRSGRESVKRTAAKLGLAHWEADHQTGSPVFHWKKD